MRIKTREALERELAKKGIEQIYLGKRKALREEENPSSYAEEKTERTTKAAAVNVQRQMRRLYLKERERGSLRQAASYVLIKAEKAVTALRKSFSSMLSPMLLPAIGVVCCLMVIIVCISACLMNPGGTDADDDPTMVIVARSQLGNEGGEPYWSWYGFSTRVDWCACFVSWCAEQCGYIDSGMVPKFAGCYSGMRWFQNKGQWLENTIVPSAGMIIFFDWDNKAGSGPQNGRPDHVGIVEKVDAEWIYTIEGNSGDVCCRRQYPVGDYEILGYGIAI